MSDRLVSVAIAYSQSDIAVLTSFFEGHGIWTARHSYQQVAAQWAWTLALGGVRFQVRAEDADAARNLLADIEPQPFAGRIFTGNWWFDLVLALVLMVTATPPPARVPAQFLLEPRAVSRAE